MTRARLLSILKPVFGLSMLAYVVSQLELQALAELWESGDRWLLAAGLATFLLSFGALQALRLHVLVRRYTGGLSGSLQLFAVGAFFNNFLPSNVGGDAVRLHYLRGMRDGDWAAPFALLLLHRVSGIVLLWAIAVVQIALTWPWLPERLAAAGVELAAPPAGVWVGGPAVVAAGLWLLTRSGPGRRLLDRVEAPLRRCRVALAELHAFDLAWLVVTTLLFHLGRALALHYTLRFTGHDIPVLSLLPVLAIVAVMMVLPVTVGGLGLLEGSVAGLLALLGVPLTAGATTALVMRGALLLLAAVGGVVYLSKRGELGRPVAAPVDDGPSPPPGPGGAAGG